MIKTVEMRNGRLVLLDQTRLPAEEVYREYDDYLEIGKAIKDMIVRGAPAIGVTAAIGVVVGSEKIETDDVTGYKNEIEKICDFLAGTRPTAVNLFWAIKRMKAVLENENGQSVADLKRALWDEAEKIIDHDLATNKTMGTHGAELVHDGATILTHCNAGALATAGGYGTALGVIKVAHEQGKKINVFVDETRPFLQGARLTAWEFVKEKIPARLITDNMAGYFMKKGEVDMVIVGADRIAANGDTANKIGTYSLSILCKEHGIPLYITAPLSTIDREIPHGGLIPIENRPASEVTEIKGTQIAPVDVAVENPAFDVTDNENISAIITEKGVIYPPFESGIKNIFS
ncbi:MAG: S-methyl-5-thioribose-1-phosphate isomerase [Nitrospinota bacterium]